MPVSPPSTLPYWFEKPKAQALGPPPSQPAVVMYRTYEPLARPDYSIAPVDFSSETRRFSDAPAGTLYGQSGIKYRPGGGRPGATTGIVFPDPRTNLQVPVFTAPRRQRKSAKLQGRAPAGLVSPLPGGAPIVSADRRSTMGQSLKAFVSSFGGVVTLTAILIVSVAAVRDFRG